MTPRFSARLLSARAPEAPVQGRWRPAVFLLLAGAALAVPGCARPAARPQLAGTVAPEAAPTSPAPPAAAAPLYPAALLEPEPPDPVDEVIESADDLYLQGMEALRQGDEPGARAAFDASVATYLDVDQVLAGDRRLQQEFEDLILSIHQVVTESQQMAPETQVWVEDLKEITAYLTPEEAERERDRVRQTSATVVFDFPVEINDKVAAFIDAFSGSRKKQFEPGMVRSGRFVPMIRRIFREEGIPQDLCYLSHVESAFKTTAYSRARARGLFQFIPSTGRNYGLRSDWWVDMRSDPELSARAAATYLRVLYGIYGDWYLAMAEYNGGPRVRRAWNRSGRTATFWDLAKTRLLRPETRNYIPQILAAVVLHKSPEKYGLTTERDAEIDYETAELPVTLDLRVAARLAGTSLEHLMELNPGLRRMATPPDYADFPLRVPPGMSSQFLTRLAALPESERLPWYRHSVRRGETISTIAARYGTSIQAIKQANSLRNANRISIGQDLMIPGSAVRVAALEPGGEDAGKPGERRVHRVSRGDTLFSISRRYRTDVASLVAWNSLSDAALIRAGQRLTVYPGTRAADTVAASGPGVARAGGAGRERESTVYRVRSGDTLYEIARRHGVSVSALQSWNGMGRGTLIRPGMRLTLYR